MHVVCLILEYFLLKPGSLKTLPPPHRAPPPKKNNVKVWSEYFCSRLNNIDQGGVTMLPNSQSASPVSKKVQNSYHFLSKIVA